MLIFEYSVNIVKYILLKLFWLKFFRCKNIEFKFMLIIFVALESHLFSRGNFRFKS